MESPDDTQPRSPSRDRLAAEVSTQDDEFDEGTGGPGCLLWSVMGVSIVLFGVGIVVLAAFGGWSVGQRQAQTNATATQNVANQEQCVRLEGEVVAANPVRLGARMDFLLTQTPPVSCALTYIPTGTALYLTSQPTRTPTITPTAVPSSTPTPTVTAETTAEATAAGSGYDLDALMAEARSAMDLQDWDEAIDTLDAISAIDPAYRPDVVERMLFQALTRRARELYRTGEQLAEAIILTNRAEDLGDIGELSFERLVAGLWLDAQRNLNVNYPEAIRLLSRIMTLSPTYRDGEAARQLYNQRVAYGDALALGDDPCLALEQYTAALSQRPGDPEVETKRDDADTACTQQQQGITPQATGQAEATSTPEMAPVGQPDS